MNSVPALKLLVVAPQLIVSTLLTCMIGALLPPSIGLVVFVGGLTLVTVLARGYLEGVAARVLYGARPLNDAEATTLAPLLSDLHLRDVSHEELVVYTSPAADGDVQALGRCSIVVPGNLVLAIDTGRLTEDQAVDLVARAVLRHRAMWPEYDLALRVWTLPWQLLQQVFRGVGALLSRLPMIALAWRVRAVVATVATAQSISDGHPAIAALIAAFVAMTYLAPVWQRRLNLALEMAANHEWTNDSSTALAAGFA